MIHSVSTAIPQNRNALPRRRAAPVRVAVGQNGRDDALPIGRRQTNVDESAERRRLRDDLVQRRIVREDLRDDLGRELLRRTARAFGEL
jgi:hypothetical protein